MFFRHEHLRFVAQPRRDFDGLAGPFGAQREQRAAPVEAVARIGGAVAVREVLVVQTGKFAAPFEHLADDDDRLALDSGGLDLAGDVGDGAAHHDLVGPAGAVDHRRRGLRRTARREEFLRQLPDSGHAQEDAERAAAGSEFFERLAVRHRGAPGVAGQDRALAQAGHGEFGFQRRRRREYAADAGDDAVRQPEAVEFAVLLGDRAVHRRVAGVEPHHGLARFIGGLDFGDHGGEVESGAVDPARGGRGVVEQLLIDQRPRVDHEVGAFQGFDAAKRDQVRRARPGSDESDGSCHLWILRFAVDRDGDRVFRFEIFL